MSELLRIVVVVVALVFSGLSVGLLLRRRISERSSLLWFAGTFVVLLLAIFPQILNGIANRMGVDYPPSLLYLVGIMALLLIVLYQSIQISRLDEKLRKIGQVVALMGFDVHAAQSPAEFQALVQVAADIDQARVKLRGEQSTAEFSKDKASVGKKVEKR